MAEIAHRFANVNGIRLHYAEMGVGPCVLLCHGFPESWYSWRHQIRALADAGFHAVAPDMRGYGQTDRPAAVETYDIFQLTGDLVGLVDALGAEPVVIVGHDWGAWITQGAALFRPDLFRAQRAEPHQKSHPAGHRPLDSAGESGRGQSRCPRIDTERLVIDFTRTLK